jgi:hypothetical protein
MRRIATEPAALAPEAPGRRERAVTVALRRRWFEAGVVAATVGVAAFLLVQLTAYPPHEDEALALFIGRKSLVGVLDTVLGQRGGAPLHFVLAWIVAHAGGGLTELRLVSAIFAVASVPVIAVLGARVAGRATGLAATELCAASWMLLFHGVYGRMYSLFLFTSALSYLALLHAVDRRTRGAWALWALAVLACVAAHPYGALVLASQAVFVLVARIPVRVAGPPFAAVAILGIPFWRTDLVLAGRFDVGVGHGTSSLGDPGSIATYFKDVAGDFTTGVTGLVVVALLLALAGFVSLLRRRRRSALLVAAVFATPVVALIVAKLGSAPPRSGHLIFALPFFGLILAEGVIWLAARLGRKRAPLLAAVGILAILPAEVAQGWNTTPELYSGEPRAQVGARAAAAAWLAARARPDDVLFGYEPVYVEAWRKGGHVSTLVVPRADAKLALDALEGARKPLGRGVWLFDASERTNKEPRATIPRVSLDPAADFETAAFGPYLVIRTTKPTGCVAHYLELSRRVAVVAASPPLRLGDAGTNRDTMMEAQSRLRHEKPPPPC